VWSIVFSILVIILVFYSGIWFLTSGIRALSLAGVVGNYFLFLQIFFSEKKKEGRDIPDIFSIFCEKFAEKGCISEFLSEKHPS
jgi:hypothetical protein